MKTVIAYLVSGVKQIGIQMIGITIACVSLFVGLTYSFIAGVVLAALLLGICWAIDFMRKNGERREQKSRDDS